MDREQSDINTDTHKSESTKALPNTKSKAELESKKKRSGSGMRRLFKWDAFYGQVINTYDTQEHLLM